MLNDVNINYVIILLVSGSVLLAAIYHTILYMHRGGRLLALYSIYLWATLAYCTFRMFITGDHPVYNYFNPDEVLQMISFIMYVRFAANALDIDPVKDKYQLLFARMTPLIIGSYLVINTILTNIGGGIDSLYWIAKIIARVYLLVLGLLLLVLLLRKRKSLFYKYLGAGAISMIIFGLISSIANLSPPGSFALGAISWLMFGFFSDVVFFSAAMGHRIRQEYNEREKSLREVIQKDAELKQKEVEKIKAVYETKEKERTRLAQDLHDEIGATLSGIALYSHLAQQQLAEQQNSKAQASLETMKQSASNMVNRLNDIVWAVNPKNDSLVGLINRVKEYALEMATTKNIRVLTFISDDISDISLPTEYRKNIYFICKEAVNNSIKYSNCSQLEIDVKHDAGYIYCNITDNGNGFSSSTIKKGNGLDNIQQRTREINGDVKIISENKKGTSIRVRCKITQ